MRARTSPAVTSRGTQAQRPPDEGTEVGRTSSTEQRDSSHQRPHLQLLWKTPGRAGILTERLIQEAGLSNTSVARERSRSPTHEQIDLSPGVEESANFAALMARAQTEERHRADAVEAAGCFTDW